MLTFTLAAAPQKPQTIDAFYWSWRRFCLACSIPGVGSVDVLDAKLILRHEKSWASVKAMIWGNFVRWDKSLCAHLCENLRWNVPTKLAVRSVWRPHNRHCSPPQKPLTDGWGPQEQTLILSNLRMSVTVCARRCHLEKFGRNEKNKYLKIKPQHCCFSKSWNEKKNPLWRYLTLIEIDFI